MARLKISRRVWWSVPAVVAAGVLVAATWLVAARFQSPAQREASAAPPPPAPVVVEIERGDLTETTTVNVQGKATGGRTVALPVKEGAAVVTRPGIATGGELGAGQVVLWVNSRPVITLRGAFPLFRDLAEGDEGDDVQLLQEALVDLGYDIRPDGQFGSYTGACVRDLYETVGAEPVTRKVPVVSEGSSVPSSESAQSGAETQAGGSEPAAGAGRSQDSGQPKQKEITIFPVSEALVLPALPVTVESVPVVGTRLTADNAKLALSGSGVTLEGSIPASVAVRLSTDTTGEAVVGDVKIPVRIEAIKAAQEKAEGDGEDGGNEKTGGGSSSESRVTLVAAEGAFPGDWAGKDAINVTLNLSEPLIDVLKVPQRAIAADASGSQVLAQKDDGTFEQVSVVEKTCVAGICVVEESDTIKAGVRVRVDR